MDEYDFTFERDEVAKRFLLTAHTEQARDLLNEELASASSEWWGKSLIVKRYEVDGLLGQIFIAGMEINMKGDVK